MLLTYLFIQNLLVEHKNVYLIMNIIQKTYNFCVRKTQSCTIKNRPEKFLKINGGKTHINNLDISLTLENILFYDISKDNGRFMESLVTREGLLYIF